MKRFLLSLPILLITSPAFAEGRYQDGGCTDEQLSSFCSMIGFLLAGFTVFVVVLSIWDDYKMKTDPDYRARAEIIHREYEEKRRQRGN